MYGPQNTSILSPCTGQLSGRHSRGFSAISGQILSQLLSQTANPIWVYEKIVAYYWHCTHFCGGKSPKIQSSIVLLGFQGKFLKDFLNHNFIKLIITIWKVLLQVVENKLKKASFQRRLKLEEIFFRFIPRCSKICFWTNIQQQNFNQKFSRILIYSKLIHIHWTHIL